MKSIWLAFCCLLFLSVATRADDAQTFKSMLALAEKGEAEAQYHLGMMYNNGIGTPQNPRQAFEWFRKAAAGGDPLGAYKLGCYYDGQGQGVVEQNPDEALKYKLISANEGYMLAQFDSAVLLAQKGDFENAVRALRLAADQGDAKAHFGLYQSYLEGKGVPRNLPLAFVSFKLSLMLSNAEMDNKAKAALDSMSAQMSEADMAKAQAMVFEWRPNPTMLTRKAMRGFAEAEEYVMRRQ